MKTLISSLSKVSYLLIECNLLPAQVDGISWERAEVRKRAQKDPVLFLEVPHQLQDLFIRGVQRRQARVPSSKSIRRYEVQYLSDRDLKLHDGCVPK